MKTLKIRIAELIYESENLDEKVVPRTWRLQVPLGTKTIKLFSDDYLLPGEFENTWVIELDLPKGYDNQDYEDALEELFPGTLTKGDSDNESVRIIKRKYLEDRLDSTLNKRNTDSKEYPNEGIGWLHTKYFKVNPQEDEVNGGRSYFYAESKDHRTNPVIIDEATGESTDKGMVFFEFHATYILKDDQGNREVIAISRVPGGYRVDSHVTSIPTSSGGAW